MKTLLEAGFVLCIGAAVGVLLAVSILIRSAQAAWDLLGETDGQHGN